MGRSSVEHMRLPAQQEHFFFVGQLQSKELLHGLEVTKGAVVIGLQNNGCLN